MRESGKIEVVTRTTCGRCGACEEVSGAHSGEVPDGWVRANLTFRHPGSGWANSTRHEWILCHDCGVDVKDFAYPNPNRVRTEQPTSDNEVGASRKRTEGAS